jgi:hypothetical protein
MGWTLADRIFIVPAAHFRVDALRFQLEMYELFHRTTIGRLGHSLGTPIALVGWFTATLAVHPWLGLSFAVATGFGMVANVLRLDRLIAALTALATLGLALLASAIVHASGDGACVTGIAITLVGCALQTFSHLAEDVPPPQSGSDQFVPARAWLGRLTLREAARSVALTLGVFFWLEAWASLRILPLQILHVAMRLGHRPELRRALDARVAAIVAGADPRWRDADAR